MNWSKRVVLYARISVTTEESVSVARQLESGRHYARARGWEVVGEFVDAGYSAISVKPEKRPGWKQLMESDAWFDAVIIWKVDRLARRVLDFLNADQQLQARGAAIVCVEQAIDMTTSEGRAFAQMLAVFGELEGQAISERTTAAKEHLVRTGRVAGGSPPYGWRSVPNPHGPGKVLAQDPEQIGWVQAMAQRTLDGCTVNSTARWLTEQDAPLPRANRQRRIEGTWKPGTVNRLVRNPLLAGMLLYNPGAKSTAGRRGKPREVLRDDDGNPVVREHLAIVSVADHHRLLEVTSHKVHPAGTPGSEKRATRPILSGLVTCGVCGHEGRHLDRGVQAGQRPAMYCKRCKQSVIIDRLAAHLERRLLAERGDLSMYVMGTPTPADQGLANRLASVEHSITSIARALVADGADTRALTVDLADLKVVRTMLQRQANLSRRRQLVESGQTVAEVWALCDNDWQRRDILKGQIAHLSLHRGKGAGTSPLNPDRVRLTWRSDTTALIPTSIDLTGTPAAPVDYVSPWVSLGAAAELTGLPIGEIRRAVRDGHIRHRGGARHLPGLLRSSALAYAESDRPAAPDGRSLHTDDRRPSPQHGYRWLSVPEAAGQLDLCPATLRGRLRSNLIPHLRRDGYYWLREDFARAEANRPLDQRGVAVSWVTHRAVVERTELTMGPLRRAIREGFIQQQRRPRATPSISWASVQAFLGVPAAEVMREARSTAPLRW